MADLLDPGFGFDLIRVVVLATEPLGPRQGDLGADARPGGRDAGEGVSALIDRFIARFGADRVLRFVPLDSHDPFRAARTVPAAGTTPLSSWPQPRPGEPPLRPIQVFVPPQLIEAVAEVPDGPPLRFRWRRILHEVTLAEGPERIAGEWWRDGPPAAFRDYYRVEDREGRRFWVFRLDGDGSSAHALWYLHGLFA